MTPQKSTDRVKCFVRIRPSSNFAHQNIEILPGENTEIKNKILQLKANNNSNSDFANKPVADNLQKSWKFNVDDVLYNAGQMQVYDIVAKNLVEKAMDGYSGTLVAYGESGSGKTFTLSGARDHSDFAQRGLSPRAIGHIFEQINSTTSQDISYSIAISYLEISGNKLSDLLADPRISEKLSKKGKYPTKLEVFEDEANPGSTKVDGLSKISVKNETEAFKYFLIGDKQRSKGAHSIFTIYISSKSHHISGGTLKYSELKFVDLCSWGSTLISNNNGVAGSFSGIKAASIPSLSFLEQVIIALKSTKYESIPWRSCTLTHVLKGNFRRRSTVLLNTIYGDKIHLQGSLTSLRFSARLNNMPVEEAHTEINDAESQVASLKNEIEKLKSELKMRYVFSRTNDKAAPCSSYDPLTEKDIENMQIDVRNYLNRRSNQLDTISLQHVNKLYELMREEYLRQESVLLNKIKAKYSLVEKNSDDAKSNMTKDSGKSGNSDKTGNSDKSNGKGKGKNDDKNKNQKDQAGGGKNAGGSKAAGGKNASDSSRTSLVGPDGSNQDLNNTACQSQNQLQNNQKTSASNINLDNKGNRSMSINLNNCSIQEIFEDFKKNAGQNTYHNILNCKQQIQVNKVNSAAQAVKINSLVDAIDRLSEKLSVYEKTNNNNNNNNNNSKNIISEAEFQLRQEQAKNKTHYMTLKHEFQLLQNEEIRLLSELEDHRRKLINDFSEENQSNTEIYNLCIDLTQGLRNKNNGSTMSSSNREFNNVIFLNDEARPPFAIPEQIEQDSPSFEAWHGARNELAVSLKNSGGVRF